MCKSENKAKSKNKQKFKNKNLRQKYIEFNNILVHVYVYEEMFFQLVIIIMNNKY